MTHQVSLTRALKWERQCYRVPWITITAHELSIVLKNSVQLWNPATYRVRMPEVWDSLQYMLAAEAAGRVIT